MTAYRKHLIKIVAVAAVLAGAVFLYVRYGRKESSFEIGKGQIADVRTMVEICSMEVYNEEPVLDTIDNIVLFAVQKQRGSISFDMESLEIDDSGDTVRVVLPKEIIDLKEATDDNSWKVIDTKNIGFLGPIRSDRLTIAQENKIKAKLMKRSRKRLYDNGTVAKARREGRHSLEVFLSAVYGKPALVTDPTPRGAGQ